MFTSFVPSLPSPPPSHDLPLGTRANSMPRLLMNFVPGGNSSGASEPLISHRTGILPMDHAQTRLPSPLRATSLTWPVFGRSGYLLPLAASHRIAVLSLTR